ncbi:hypothetical protein ACS127_16950 [Amphibacillus sp. Q70]|uniref:hypothetical protein n=1 Tax=Amphibacillus sp. Q70 TaxID=3453416 RepID=UPI003F879330
MKNDWTKYVGYALIALAIIIFLSLGTIVFPNDSSGSGIVFPNDSSGSGIVIHGYYFEAFINCVRYTGLALISFVLGIKLTFKQ